MRTLLPVLLLIGLCATSLSADVPATMSFQGRLTDATGNPVADGTYSVAFDMYSSATGGASTWTEVRSITTADGLFSTLLGSTTPIPDSALSDTAAFLEITVESDPPLSPRTRLGSSAYSFSSRSVQGAGPIQLHYEDVSSGDETYGRIALESPTTGASKRNYRHQIFVSAASGDSSHLEVLVSADSTVKHESQHGPISVTKSIDKATPLLRKSMVFNVGSSGDSTHWERMISADSGVIESTTTETSSGLATGKRQHKPITISKSSAVSRLSDVLSCEFLMHPDSGLIETTKTESASGLATGKRQHKPFTITKSSAVTNFTDSVDWDCALDVDTGYSETAAMNKADLIAVIHKEVNQTREHVLLSRQVGVPGAVDSTSLGLTTDNLGASMMMNAFHPTLGTNGVETAAHNGRSTVRPYDLYAPGDSSATEMSCDDSEATVGTVFDHGSHLSQAGMTSKQGAAAGALRTIASAQTYGLDMSTDTVEGKLHLLRTTATDSSGIEFHVSDTGESIVMSTTSSGAKWDNIVLKRGTVGSAVTISHVGASSSDGIHITSDAAAGGQIGINTDSPTAALHIAGSGCYTGTFGACSDRRFKRHIAALDTPLETVKRLRGVRYEWRADEFPQQHFPDGEQIGLIAQEVEALVPSVVLTGSDGYKSVDYAKLVPLLIEAIKAQQKQIEALSGQLSSMAEVQSELAEIRAALSEAGDADATYADQ